MKALKKIALVLVLLLPTMLVYGCGKQSPTDVVNEYFKNVEEGLANPEYLIASGEITEDGLEEDSLSEEAQRKLLEKMKEITYKVNSESINGDNAKVNVTVKGIDLNIVLEKVFEEAFEFTFEQALSGDEMTDEETNAYFDGLLVKYLEETTYSERTLDIDLTKGDEGWEVVENETLTKLLLGIDESIFGF